MSPRTRATVFLVITVAWWVLGILALVAGQVLIGLLDLVAGAVTGGFAYRSLHPRSPAPPPPTTPGRAKDEVKELRAPRPRKGPGSS